MKINTVNPRTIRATSRRLALALKSMKLNKKNKDKCQTKTKPIRKTMHPESSSGSIKKYPQTEEKKINVEKHEECLPEEELEHCHDLE